MINKVLKLNRVIVYLTASDVFTWGLVYVVTALNGLYLAESVGLNENDVVRFVGIGTALYSLSNGLLQIPIGLAVDKIKGTKDEIYNLS